MRLELTSLVSTVGWEYQILLCSIFFMADSAQLMLNVVNIHLGAYMAEVLRVASTEGLGESEFHPRANLP